MALGKDDIVRLIRDGARLDAPQFPRPEYPTTSGAPQPLRNPRVAEFERRGLALERMALILRDSISEFVADVLSWRDGTSRDHDHRDGQPGQATGLVGPLYQPDWYASPKQAPNVQNQQHTPQDWYEDIWAGQAPPTPPETR